jgi:hypothetical protein
VKTQSKKICTKDISNKRETIPLKSVEAAQKKDWSWQKK